MTEERDYNDPIYKKARKETLKRDGFKCQWPNCGSNERLRVHHIRTWSEHPALRFVLGNLITLCKKHHDFIWNKEDIYAAMFFQILKKNSDDRRSKKQRKPRKFKGNKSKKGEDSTPKTYAQRYAEAKRRARKGKG